MASIPPPREPRLSRRGGMGTTFLAKREADGTPPVRVGGSIKTRLITLGEWFFRQRSWTPIPFILALVLVSAGEYGDAITWVPGLILLALGEGLRLWGVAVVGKGSRTRGGGVGQLAMHGPYAYVRNPLYLGNFLLTLGATCLSELLWLIPAVIVLFVVQYVPIVLWEERVLAERFGPPYAAYCQQVPRWIPRWRRRAAGGAAPPYQWRAAFWSERSTFGTLAVLLLVMCAKEDLRHLPKYFRKHPFATHARTVLPPQPGG